MTKSALTILAALDQQWPRGLTRRESEVVLLVGTGMSNKEIARQLGLSVGTVKMHIHHILRKTGARSRCNLAVRIATLRIGRLQAGIDSRSNIHER
jgi:DNA-binding NarL/FixJ family response regulator